MAVYNSTTHEVDTSNSLTNGLIFASYFENSNTLPVLGTEAKDNSAGAGANGWEQTGSRTLSFNVPAGLNSNSGTALLYVDQTGVASNSFARFWEVKDTELALMNAGDLTKLRLAVQGNNNDFSTTIISRFDSDHLHTVSWDRIAGRKKASYASTIETLTGQTWADEALTGSTLELLNRADGARGLNALVKYALFWDRELSDAEIASIEANPYQLVRPIGGGGSTVENSLAVSWNTLNQVSGSSSFLWGVLQNVASQAQVDWNVLNAVVSSSELAWHVLAQVSNSATLEWSVFNAVANSTQIDWNALNSVLGNVEVQHAIQNATSNSVEVLFNTLNANAVQNSVQMDWALLNAVSNAAQINWSALTTAENGMQLRYQLLNQVSQSLGLDWSLLAAVSNTVALVWDSQELGTVSSSLQINYAILSAVSGQLQAHWNTLQSVGVTTELLYSVAQSVANQIQAQWNTLAGVENGVQITWESVALVQGDLQLSWTVQTEQVRLPMHTMIVAAENRIMTILDTDRTMTIN